MKKVSVIVPIYKVEMYLHRCVDSILNQTYKNLEVILVNDGSPDRCGAIANHYAEADNRVRVVHKENGGLSDARNAGMNYATGAYTVFVDSDDWLAMDMIRQLVTAAENHEADVVQAAFYYAYDQYLLFDQRHFKSSGEIDLFDNKSLMQELVKNEKVKNFAWGKLYKTDLISDIPFKKGVLFEDVFWAHQIMHRVKRFVLLNKPLYYYLQRSDSIVSTYTAKNLDIVVGLKERHQFIEEHYKELVNDSYRAILVNSLIHYNLLSIHWTKDRNGAKRKWLKEYIYHHAEQMKRAVQDDEHIKKQLTLFLIHPTLNMAWIVLKKTVNKLELKNRQTTLQRIEGKHAEI